MKMENDKKTDGVQLPPVSFKDTAKNLRRAGKNKEADKLDDLWRRLDEHRAKRGSKS